MILSSIEVQSIIIEAKKTPNKRAGRVIQLHEEWRIRDNQIDFYFKSPSNLKVSPDGSIFVLDENQLLEFSSDGKFIRNYFRSGQGPGEFSRIEDYLPLSEKIVIHQRSPNKVVIFDRLGNLIKEFKPQETTARLLAIFQDKYLMAQHAFPQIEKIKKEEGEILEVNWNFCLVSENGEVEKIEGLYPTRWFFKRLPTAVVADYMTEIIWALLKGRYLLFTHTEDYELKIFDLSQKKLVKSIKRKYKKVSYKSDKPKEERPGFKTLDVPRSYFNDIQKILVREEKILVFTSTVDRRKGFQVDVFDSEGSYLDIFYFPLHLKIGLSELARYPLNIQGNTLLVIEKDDSGNIFLVKYQMLL
ncbi:MAG: 6-bladed beta-propeller [Candidatus Aminicenantes bacterium]|nr:6-bladed beta-propeller [Candidatus Aminicenantes bacterium]